MQLCGAGRDGVPAHSKMVRRVARAVYAAAVALACLCMLVFPLPKQTSAGKVLCIWEDGSVTEEGYGIVCSALVGISDDGTIELLRGTHVGHIPSSDAMNTLLGVLRSDSLADMLRLDGSKLSFVERMALLCEYSSTVFYAGEAFSFTGARVERAKPDRAEEVRLLFGDLPAGYLAKMGATALHVAWDAELSAAALVGSSVETVTASAPYSSEDGALYRTVGDGKTLVAAVPSAERLELSMSRSAEGALLPCESLRSLTLPFLGASEGLAGDLGYLFSDGTRYCVPATLADVKVTGGMLSETAFYLCPGIQTVDVCGVLPQNIHPRAFLGATSLQELHVPVPVELAGEFYEETAPCGCIVYRRK